MWMPKANRLEIFIHDKIDRLTPVGRFIRIVLLLAVKEGATEIRFHPDREENLQLVVNGAFKDLVPVPQYILPNVSAELQRLAGLPVPLQAFAGVLARFRFRNLDSTIARPFKGRFRLQIDGKRIQVLVRITSVRSGPRVMLRLVNPTAASSEAGPLLQELCRNPGEHERNV